MCNAVVVDLTPVKHRFTNSDLKQDSFKPGWCYFKYYNQGWTDNIFCHADAWWATQFGAGLGQFRAIFFIFCHFS